MGKLSELPPGGVLEKTILARRIAVFNYEGKLYGIEADCRHMRASLATGKIENGILTCKWHSWKYRLDSGECITNKVNKLKRYEVLIEGDDIFLKLG